jgi:hypothetical protein
MRHAFFCTIALSVLFPFSAIHSPVQAQSTQDFTVGYAFQKCEKAGNIGSFNVPTAYEAFNVGFCIGIMRGTSDILVRNCALGLSDFDGQPTALATRSDSSFAAKWQAFRKWAQNNPEHWDEPLEFGIINALRETFPCGNIQ